MRLRRAGAANRTGRAAAAAVKFREVNGWRKALRIWPWLARLRPSSRQVGSRAKIRENAGCAICCSATSPDLFFLRKHLAGSVRLGRYLKIFGCMGYRCCSRFISELVLHFGVGLLDSSALLVWPRKLSGQARTIPTQINGARCWRAAANRSSQRRVRHGKDRQTICGLPFCSLPRGSPMSGYADGSSAGLAGTVLVSPCTRIGRSFKSRNLPVRPDCLS